MLPRFATKQINFFANKLIFPIFPLKPFLPEQLLTKFTVDVSNTKIINKNKRLLIAEATCMADPEKKINFHYSEIRRSNNTQLQGAENILYY